MWIKRNLLNDTFDIFISDDVKKSLRIGCEKPYISINNNIIIEGDSVVSRTSKIVDGKSVYKAFHGMIKDYKFRNIKTLNIGIMIGDSIVYMHMFEFSFFQESSHMNVPIGKVAEIKSIDSIHSSFFQNLEDLSNNNGEKSPTISLKKNYTSLFYRPLERKRDDVITDLADIYIEPPIISDYRKGYIPNLRSKIKTTGVASGLETFVDKKEDKEDLDISNTENERVAKFLGTVKIDDSTYYDYKKHKTIKGYSSTAKIGEFIPFNFKGSYSWTQEIKLFEYLKSFEFRTAVNFKHSLLNAFDGDVVLSVENNFDNYIDTNLSISLENLEILKSKDIISLRALERMSNEKIN